MQLNDNKATVSAGQTFDNRNLLYPNNDGFLAIGFEFTDFENADLNVGVPVYIVLATGALAFAEDSGQSPLIGYVKVIDKDNERLVVQTQAFQVQRCVADESISKGDTLIPPIYIDTIATDAKLNTADKWKTANDTYANGIALEDAESGDIFNVLLFPYNLVALHTPA